MTATPWTAPSAVGVARFLGGSVAGFSAFTPHLSWPTPLTLRTADTAFKFPWNDENFIWLNKIACQSQCVLFFFWNEINVCFISKTRFSRNSTFVGLVDLQSDTHITPVVSMDLLFTQTLGVYVVKCTNAYQYVQTGWWRARTATTHRSVSKLPNHAD